MTAFVGLDGFVDDILHVVDKRESAEKYSRLPTIAQLAQRLAAAAGKSTNIELVSQLTKLGGNGPIMANALASFGLKVTYLGILGYPNLHPVFAEFARRAEVHSIAEPGYTDALEFEDGKIMLGKHQSLKQMNWENILARYGRDKFADKFGTADLVGFVNWTMLTYMSDIWSSVLKEVCPSMRGPRRKLFIDLADPEKRTREDIRRALTSSPSSKSSLMSFWDSTRRRVAKLAATWTCPPKTTRPKASRNSARRFINGCRWTRLSSTPPPTRSLRAPMAWRWSRGPSRPNPRSPRGPATTSTRASVWANCSASRRRIAC